MKLRIIVVAMLALGLLSAGCTTTSPSGKVYTREQTRQEQVVRMGTVESVREVTIEGTQTGVGTAAGAAVGGIGGSTIGHDKGAAIAAVLGAVAGGVAGKMAEEGVTRKDGLEITVRMESGQLIAITQEADEQFAPGDRVRILSGGGVTRVAH